MPRCILNRSQYITVAKPTVIPPIDMDWENLNFNWYDIDKAYKDWLRSLSGVSAEEAPVHG